MRFLASVMLSSPAVVFVYSPLLVVQTIAGIAVPFATGCFIDALIGGTPPITPFAILAALLLVKAVMTPCLQRFILSRSREIELMLQKRVLGAIIDCPPSELSFLTDGTLVAKMTRDTYAVGGFVSGLYPRLLIAGVTMIASGCALHSRSPALSSAAFRLDFAFGPTKKRHFLFNPVRLLLHATFPADTQCRTPFRRLAAQVAGRPQGRQLQHGPSYGLVRRSP